MNAPIFTTRSWGGGLLEDENIVRFVYLDEAGISNREEEPYTVVAGVFVEPDQQWKPLEAHYRDLANDVFPGADPYRFIFHAKDIWHGSGQFSREDWTLSERLSVLRRLAQIPHLFSLPITVGYTKRHPPEAYGLLTKNKGSREQRKRLQYFDIFTAFFSAVNTIDAWMDKNCPNEVTMLFMEDGGKINAALEQFHRSYTEQSFGGGDEAFRTQHIIESIVFKKKGESIPLQIADHCAFIAKRHLMERDDIKSLYDLLRPAVEWGTLPARPIELRLDPSHLEPLDEADIPDHPENTPHNL